MSHNENNDAKRSRITEVEVVDVDLNEGEEIIIKELDNEAKQVFISDLSSICDIDHNTAESLLQAHNWNIQASIDNFLDKSADDDVMIIDENEGAASSQEKKNKNPPAIVMSQGSTEIVDSAEDPQSLQDSDKEKEMNQDDKDTLSGSSGSSGSSSPSSARAFSTWAPEKLSIISWNLDGLDDHNLEKRTEAVLGQTLIENHAVIFFQELIPQTFEYLANHLVSKYVPIVGTDDSSAQYLTATFLRRNHVIYEEHCIIPYPGTTMGRNLLVTKAFIGRAKLCLLNTHLESTAEFSTERQNQLKLCFKTCETFPPEYNIIFGGDLNLRDSEVNLPPNMADLWVKCGSRESCRYTWDLTRNTNKQMPAKYQPRLRFDRLYFRSSVPETLTPEFFGVTGIEKVAGTQSFPSDHWAIMSFFDVAKEARKPLPKKRKAERSPSKEFT